VKKQIENKKNKKNGDKCVLNKNKKMLKILKHNKRVLMQLKQKKNLIIKQNINQITPTKACQTMDLIGTKMD